MTLAVPVPHPACPSTILLRAGVRLDPHAISRLRDLGAGHVWIRHPSLDFVVANINPLVMRACGELAGHVSRAWDAVRENAESRLDYAAYGQTVTALLERLSESPRAAVFVDQVVGTGPAPMRHATNVCFLSLIMGMKLEFYLVRERTRLNTACARDITNLGLGSLLHDIGLAMLRDLPDAGAEPLNPAADDVDGPWRAHVIAGHERIRGGLDPSAAAVVLHHHQHFDGSGFPAAKEPGPERPAPPTAPRRPAHAPKPGLRGMDIHIFARIAAAADLFDRLRYPPGVALAERPATVTVLKQMLGPPFSAWLDPLVLKAMLSVTPPYAPGVWVTLSDGRSAVVESWSALDPCRPVVRIIDPLAEASWRAEVASERVDLRKERWLEVAKLEGRDIRADNFYPGKGEFDLAAIAKRMENAAA